MRGVLSIVLVCVTASAAAADGFYVTESFGGSDVKDELGERMDQAFRVRVALGIRRGRWALEGWMGGHLGLAGMGAEGASCGRCGGGDYHRSGTDSLFTYGLDVKYLQPIAGPNLEVYLRGGVSRGLLDDVDDHAGRGLGVGAGIQLKGKVRALGFLAWPLFFTRFGPKVTAALFLDTGYELYRLHRGGREGNGAIDAALTSMSVGFAVGSDF